MVVILPTHTDEQDINYQTLLGYVSDHFKGHTNSNAYSIVVSDGLI